MKLFSTTQIRDIDRLTIEYEPVSSINLMERAALSIFSWFAENISSRFKIIVFVGHGNNGGDGLALARLLIEIGYSVEVFMLETSSPSPDCQVNLNRLKRQGVIDVQVIKSEDNFPSIKIDSIVVDALFGSGLTRPIEGIAAKLINYINGFNAKVISIDIPSGLFGEVNPVPNNNPVVKASITLTLQFPKISFFFAENSRYVGEFIVLPIGLNQLAIEKTETNYQFVDIKDVKSICKHRHRFNHKGDFGHCLIIAGSKGMIGAAVLASKSCIKTGAGLVSTHIPKVGYTILQQSVPEVMVDEDIDENYFTTISSILKYSAIVVGPGLGKSSKTVEGFSKLLDIVDKPLVIDADGLNIIAENSELLEKLPQGAIITPHPGEFDRLFGKSNSGYERLIKAIEKSAKYGIVIVLKGADTQVVCPNGQVFFNSTGNPGMATAGSGDVLSGIIGSLLAQGYESISGAIFAVYIHGLAGDLAKSKVGVDTLIASDIIDNIGNAYKLIDI